MWLDIRSADSAQNDLKGRPLGIAKLISRVVIPAHERARDRKGAALDKAEAFA